MEGKHERRRDIEGLSLTVCKTLHQGLDYRKLQISALDICLEYTMIRAVRVFDCAAFVGFVGWVQNFCVWEDASPVLEDLET
jgi:hypothetical protein